MAKPTAKKAPAPVKTSFWQNDRNVALVLAGIAFLLYAKTIGYDFALDDRAVTYENKFVKEGFGGFGDILTKYYWAGFWENYSGLFRPLSLLLFAVEWQFAPGNPAMFHFVNVLLYAVCAYLLYRTLRELLRNQAMMLALLATALWVVLPVHVEVVANVKSGDELLSLLFFLLSFRQLLKWSDSGKILPLLFSAGYFFLALLSKEGAVLFLPVLLLALLMFRDKKPKALLLPLVSLAVVTGAWLGWHAWVIGNGPAYHAYDYRDNALLSSSSRIDQIGTAIGTQALYWVKMTIGYPLSYDYSYNQVPVDGFASLWTIVSLLGIGAAGYFAVRHFRKTPVVAFGILFYFVTFALTSNIFVLIGATFAERFTFVPSIGFTLVLAWLILKFTKGLDEKRVHTPALYILLVACALYSIRTMVRSSDWQYDSTLFIADVENAPNSSRVHTNYGVLKLNGGIAAKNEIEKKTLNDEAFVQYSTAAQLDTLNFDAAAALAQLEFGRNNYAAAISWAKRYNVILRHMDSEPNSSMVFSIMGNSYMQLQQYDSAFASFSEGEKRFPTDENFPVSLGGYYLAKHDTAQTIAYYEKAIKVNPKSTVAWDKLANVCGMSGRYERSNEAFLELTKLDPTNLRPWQMLYKNAEAMHDTAKMKEYEQAYYAHGGE